MSLYFRSAYPTGGDDSGEAHSDFVKVVPCAQIGGEISTLALFYRMFPHIPLIAAGGVSLKNASKFIFAGATALALAVNCFPPRHCAFAKAASDQQF